MTPFVCVAVVGLTLALGACAGGSEPVASRPPSQAQDRQSDISGELFGEEREAAFRRLESEDPRLFDETSCNQDADCTATRFTSCCAGDYLEGDCSWQAIHSGWLERRMEECAVEECAEGVSPCLSMESGDTPETYCAVYRVGSSIDAVCRLR